MKELKLKAAKTFWYSATRNDLKDKSNKYMMNMYSDFLSLKEKIKQ